jgi:MFS family permease
MASEKDLFAVSRTHSLFALVVLFVLMVLDHLDRNVVLSMFSFIKSDWDLTDQQLGALGSIVPFIVGLLLIPMALLVDRWSRVKAISYMAIIWSLATVGCMYAPNYSQLLFLRGVVGFGEAGYAAAGCALLAYHFPERLRSVAIGTLNAGVAFGFLMGVGIGGVLAAKWGWQAAFGIVGAPGVLFAILVLWIHDYPTAEVTLNRSEKAAGTQHVKLKAIATELFKQKTLLLNCLGSGFLQVLVGTIGWLPLYFTRYYGIDGVAAGLKTAPIALVSAVSLVFWGYIADRIGLMRPARKLGLMKMTALTGMILFVCSIALLPAGTFQYVGIIVAMFFMASSSAVCFTVAIDVTQPALRSTAASLVAIANNFLGYAIGAYLVGVLSDQFGLSAALCLVSLFALPAAYFFHIASHSYESDKAKISGNVLGSRPDLMSPSTKG